MEVFINYETIKQDDSSLTVPFFLSSIMRGQLSSELVTILCHSLNFLQTFPISSHDLSHSILGLPHIPLP